MHILQVHYILLYIWMSLDFYGVKIHGLHLSMHKRKNDDYLQETWFLSKVVITRCKDSNLLSTIDVLVLDHLCFVTLVFRANLSKLRTRKIILHQRASFLDQFFISIHQSDRDFLMFHIINKFKSSFFYINSTFRSLVWINQWNTQVGIHIFTNLFLSNWNFLSMNRIKIYQLQLV